MKKPGRVPRDSYRRGFMCGKQDREPNPPANKAEAWEWWNGYLDATKDMGIGDHGVFDQERAEIARNAKNRRGQDQSGEGESDTEEA